MLNYLLNILANPLFYFVLVGLFGALGRLWGWLQHERSRRLAAQARERQATEALRRGQPVDFQTEIAQPAATDPAARQRALQEQRAAQLRALQQKRLAELRARRQAQQQGTAKRPTPPVRPEPPQRGAPAPAKPASPRPAPRPRPAEPARRPPARPTPPLFPTAPTPPVRAVPPAVSAGAVPVEATEIGGPAPAANAYQLPAARVAGAGFAALLGPGMDLRRAVLLTEVLGPPVAERDPDQTGTF